jgi:hypothetical protein
VNRWRRGEGGIRTHGTVSRSGAFKAPALVHYATSPSQTWPAAGAASIQILADAPELRASEIARRRAEEEQADTLHRLRATTK